MNTIGVSTQRVGTVTPSAGAHGPRRGGAPLYFWHIPKTAGMSVWKWLEGHFEPQQVYRPHLLPELLRDAAESRLHGHDLFRGHFADAPLDLVGTRLTTLTVLREPVARTLSHIAHVARAEDHPLHERVVAHGGHLDAVLRDPLVRRMVQDVQCRYLGVHHVPEHEPEDEVAWVVPTGSPLRAMMAFEMSPLPVRRVLLLRALAGLARIDHVGVVEDLPGLLRRVAAQHGWTRPSLPPVENVRAPSQDHLRPERLDAGALRAVHDLTRADRHLYRAARARALIARHG